MNQGLFMFWAGSLHFFGAMCYADIMHVTLSSDRMGRKLINFYLLWLETHQLGPVYPAAFPDS